MSDKEYATRWDAATIKSYTQSVIEQIYESTNLLSIKRDNITKDKSYFISVYLHTEDQAENAETTPYIRGLRATIDKARSMLMLARSNNNSDVRIDILCRWGRIRYTPSQHDIEWSNTKLITLSIQDHYFNEMYKYTSDYQKEEDIKSYYNNQTLHSSMYNSEVNQYN